MHHCDILQPNSRRVARTESNPEQGACVSTPQNKKYQSYTRPTHSGGMPVRLVFLLKIFLGCWAGRALCARPAGGGLRATVPAIQAGCGTFPSHGLPLASTSLISNCPI